MNAVRPSVVAVRSAGLVLALGLMAGCASTAIDSNFDEARQETKARIGMDPVWLQSQEARQQAARDVDAALSKPLSADDAVRIALTYSPAVQAVLYDSAAASAQATQAARVSNPVFTFERLMRGEGDARELEITRMLTVPLLDLAVLPAKLRVADARQRQLRWQLASDVVRAAGEARTAWVRAVAAQQSLLYARQVNAAAAASAELARRMQAAGNYSKLQRAREQAFSAEAVAQLARAEQEALAARETLVRVLGLDAEQAGRLTLPERLPDLPASPRDEREVEQFGLDRRFDIASARASLEAQARQLGLGRVTSVVNGLDFSLERNGQTGLPSQRGWQLEVPLPIFDFGDASRANAQASYMAALNRASQVSVQASSSLRQQYAAYRTAYGLARHYRDEIVPLRKAISDENVLRYNGMLIGVFELIADAREQIGAVVQSIDAQRDFWLADAALQAEVFGVTPHSMVDTRAGASDQ